jgi:predicted nucleic acid-binding protein
VILVDTSAWVEYDRATGSDAHLRLRDLIAADGEVATTEPVIMEVLAGARDDARERDLRRFLNRFVLLPFESPTDFDGAVRTYRLCRAAGVTPRGLIDCLIATIAMRHRAAVLSWDADLARIGEVVALELDPASLIGTASKSSEP